MDDDSEIAERIWRCAGSRRSAEAAAQAGARAHAADLEGRQVEDWAVGDSPWKRAVEDDLAGELGLEPGEVMIDFPAKRAMFQLDLLLRAADGRVERLGPDGLPGVLDLPRVAQELYRSARVLRVFTFERRSLAPETVLHRITQPADS
jgi:hypothetical protein